MPQTPNRSAQDLDSAPRGVTRCGAGGAVAQARELFAADPAFLQGVANLETNAMTHDLGRALAEAADLIEFFTADVATSDRIWARTASFCSATAAQFDRADQGNTFLHTLVSAVKPRTWCTIPSVNVFAPAVFPTMHVALTRTCI